MSYSYEVGNAINMSQKKYKGVRRRKWGKWVSEIRVPGTQERLWLGSYVTPEAAAVAHDIAFYCLRESSSPGNLNFPLMLPAGIRRDMSPRSVQKAASDAGMAIDAQVISIHTMDKMVEVIDQRVIDCGTEDQIWQPMDDSSGSSWDGTELNGQALSISIDDYL